MTEELQINNDIHWEQQKLIDELCPEIFDIKIMLDSLDDCTAMNSNEIEEITEVLITTTKRILTEALETLEQIEMKAR